MAAPETWIELCERLEEMFGISIDLNGALFLIGMRERGLTFKEFTREEKLSLINLGSCTLYLEMGLTEKTGYDPEGWPIFRQRSLSPAIPEERKQKILQECAIRYFARILN
jgi:hypothetical protein